MQTKSKMIQVVTYLILIAGSFIMLLPLVWMVLTSLKTFTEVNAEPTIWFPENFRWDNYITAFSGFNFLNYLRNSIIIALLSVAGTLFSCIITAYAFARYKVPGQKIIFACLLLPMLLPGQVTVIPVFQLFNHLGWINTWYPLIVPSWFATNVFGIFLLRQFFAMLPVDYAEAARIDGASEWQILWNIYIPLAKPAILTLGIFTFLGSWNDLWGPLIYLHNEELYTMPVGLLNFMAVVGRADGTPMHLVMAVTTVMIIPIILIFFFAQKRFIESMASVGVKG